MIFIFKVLSYFFFKELCYMVYISERRTLLLDTVVQQQSLRDILQKNLFQKTSRNS